MRISYRAALLAALAVAALQQAPGLGQRELWWLDEVRQADVWRAVVEDGDWLILRLNGAPYPDKPPLHFWLSAGLAWALGSSEPMALFLGTAIGFALFIAAIFGLACAAGASPTTAARAAAVALSTPYFIGLSHYARMDFFFAACIALSWAAALRGLQSERPSGWTAAAGLLAALAVLAKGPLGAALPAAGALGALGWARRWRRLRAWDCAAAALAFALPVGGWAAAVWATPGGADYLSAIFSGQIWGRLTDSPSRWIGWGRYFATAPLAMLPWTAIPVAAALAGRGQTGGKPQSGRRGWSARSFLWAAMGGGFLTLCAVGEKHEYYLLPLLAPASALAAFWLETANPRVSERFWAAAGAIFLLIGAACAALPLANPYPVELEGAEWAGAALALGGAAAIGWRGRGAWAPQAALLAAATVWIGIATAWTMPSLDPVFSPRAMALALERIAREEGLEPIAFHLDEGALSYYLRRPCPSHEDWEAFLAAAERLGAAAAIVPLDRRGEMESLGWRIEPAGEFCQAGAYYLAARIEKRPDAE